MTTGWRCICGSLRASWHYATKHYLPVYRNLWVPGMAVVVGGRQSAVGSRWIAPRAGVYDIWASESLLRHPWLTTPLDYAAVEGPLATRYVIPLAKLPPSPPEALEWTVDGGKQPRGVRSLTLKAGSRVELVSTLPRRTRGPAGTPRDRGAVYRHGGREGVLMKLLVLSEHDVDELLTMEECIEVMADALAALARGRSAQPAAACRFVLPGRRGCSG